ncbi:MAG: hypothetical protein ACO3N7_03325 [Kiritimatiellia bacterium]
MKNKILLLLLLLSTANAEQMDLQSIVRFEGTSTLHDFTGFATSKVERVEWTPIEKGGTLSADEIEFTTEELTTHHVKRDRNMMKMFEPTLYPQITGQVSDWDLNNDGEKAATLKLKIQETELEIPVTVGPLVTDESGTHFKCTFLVSLKAFGLKRPSALGIIRVGDEVKVSVESTFHKPEAQL